MFPQNMNVGAFHLMVCKIRGSTFKITWRTPCTRAFGDYRKSRTTSRLLDHGYPYVRCEAAGSRHAKRGRPHAGHPDSNPDSDTIHVTRLKIGRHAEPVWFARGIQVPHDRLCRSAGRGVQTHRNRRGRRAASYIWMGVSSYTSTEKSAGAPVRNG
jgi:hypothetical protein